MNVVYRGEKVTIRTHVALSTPIKYCTSSRFLLCVPFERSTAMQLSYRAKQFPDVGRLDECMIMVGEDTPGDCAVGVRSDDGQQIAAEVIHALK